MKSVLASFKPKYCELIASGKNTVELCKSRPKLDAPFKVYMYQTKGRWVYKILEWLKLYQGKVIGEFVCDEINFALLYVGKYPILYKDVLNKSCLSMNEIEEYSSGKSCFAWHISDLVIYDKPKELSEFYKPCSHDCKNCKYWYSGLPIGYGALCMWEDSVITRPPQSWCYVEEV